MGSLPRSSPIVELFRVMSLRPSCVDLIDSMQNSLRFEGVWKFSGATSFGHVQNPTPFLMTVYFDMFTSLFIVISPII